MTWENKDILGILSFRHGAFTDVHAVNGWEDSPSQCIFHRDFLASLSSWI